MKWMCVLIMGGVLAAGWVQAEPPAKDPNSPVTTPEGIRFRFHAPDAQAVYLAGSFNDWAGNQNGVVTDSSARMEGPDSDGNWVAVRSIPEGRHLLKFCINGDPTGWVTPLWALEKDDQDNAVFYVSPGGLVMLRSDRNDQWKPEMRTESVTFRVFRPGAKSVHLAGDFNNWANNDQGVVTDARFAMKDPDGDGVWEIKVPLKPGRHAYNFVVNGRSWEPDPNVEQRDDENHSVINTGYNSNEA